MFDLEANHIALPIDFFGRRRSVGDAVTPASPGQASADGLAYCWGRGTLGRLGNGSTSDQNTPVRVRDPLEPGADHMLTLAGGALRIRS